MPHGTIQTDCFINIDIKASALINILSAYHIHVCDLHCGKPGDKKVLHQLLLQATLNKIKQL
ncbi:hypothetical protein [Alteromonas ponticola]|uniref:Uncharacterized protein n=1 Tax=Alteromonas ponticola TaxID=2720613 RepID=A0ABX1R6D5_9ALTE|nr:hypothetical protein [Alteromonas ponticola]NMH60682.1 hypothetical protein [Alteromonas ponticola]